MFVFQSSCGKEPAKDAPEVPLILNCSGMFEAVPFFPFFKVNVSKLLIAGHFSH